MAIADILNSTFQGLGGAPGIINAFNNKDIIKNERDRNESDAAFRREALGVKTEQANLDRAQLQSQFDVTAGQSQQEQDRLDRVERTGTRYSDSKAAYQKALTTGVDIKNKEAEFRRARDQSRLEQQDYEDLLGNASAKIKARIRDSGMPPLKYQETAAGKQDFDYISKIIRNDPSLIDAVLEGEETTSGKLDFSDMEQNGEFVAKVQTANGSKPLTQGRVNSEQNPTIPALSAGLLEMLDLANLTGSATGATQEQIRAEQTGGPIQQQAPQQALGQAPQQVQGQAPAQAGFGPRPQGVPEATSRGEAMKMQLENLQPVGQNIDQGGAGFRDAANALERQNRQAGLTGQQSVDRQDSLREGGALSERGKKVEDAALPAITRANYETLTEDGKQQARQSQLDRMYVDDKITDRVRGQMLTKIKTVANRAVFTNKMGTKSLWKDKKFESVLGSTEKETAANLNQAFMAMIGNPANVAMIAEEMGIPADTTQWSDGEMDSVMRGMLHEIEGDIDNNQLLFWTPNDKNSIGLLSVENLRKGLKAPIAGTRGRLADKRGYFE